MTRLDERFRILDPVDTHAPEPDREELLREIVRVEVRPARPAPRPRPGARAGLVGLAAVLAAGIALAMPGGTGTDVVADAYDAVSRPDTILHYTQHWTQPGSAVSPAQDLGTTEVWQAGDGSRQRTVSRFPGAGVQETALDATRSLSFNSQTGDIVEYDERVPPPPAPAGTAGTKMGDPRTLLGRARSGDTAVQELGEATVRGIPVLQFRVGECRLESRRVPATEHRKGQPPRRTTSLEQKLTYAQVVSVARDDFTPVRVEQPPCRQPPAGAKGLRLDQMPGWTIDYVSFEVLPATDANRRLLELAPHPGAPVRDGEALDAAEQRADQGEQGEPAPTATPGGADRERK